MSLEHKREPRLIPAMLLSALLLPASVCALTEGNYTYTVADGKATITDFNTSYFRNNPRIPTSRCPQAHAQVGPGDRRPVIGKVAFGSSDGLDLSE